MRRKLLLSQNNCKPVTKKCVNIFLEFAKLGEHVENCRIKKHTQKKIILLHFHVIIFLSILTSLPL